MEHLGEKNGRGEVKLDELHKQKPINTYEIKFISQIFIITMYTILYKSLEKLIHEHYIQQTQSS